MTTYGDISFGTPSYHADFNSLLEDGSLTVSRRYESSHRTPQIGESVELTDYEGNRCCGDVLSVSDKAVRVAVDLESWSPAAYVTSINEPEGNVASRGYTVDVPRIDKQPAIAEKLELVVA